MHAAKTLGRAGATPPRTAFSRPKFLGVAPALPSPLYADALAACIQRRKQS
jgi:hypothetical protein